MAYAEAGGMTTNGAEPMTALRQALAARISWPSAAERRRAWHSFERALDRHLTATNLTPTGQRR